MEPVSHGRLSSEHCCLTRIAFQSCILWYNGYQTLQVLSHVSARQADIHEAGYVHRDMKPANVMWLPRENRWTVIDFGCTARTGESIALAFTLTYAAPEVVRAFESQQRRMEASPAVDAWALGVMAFEPLTGGPAFQPLTHGCDSVRRAPCMHVEPCSFLFVQKCFQSVQQAFHDCVTLLCVSSGHGPTFRPGHASVDILLPCR